MLSNKLYDFFIILSTITLPIVLTFYLVLASIGNAPYFAQVAATLLFVNAMLGIFLRISSKSKKNDDNYYDGNLVMTGNDPDTGIPQLQLTITRDPNELAAKRTIRFKSVDQR